MSQKKSNLVTISGFSTDLITNNPINQENNIIVETVYIDIIDNPKYDYDSQVNINGEVILKPINASHQLTLTLLNTQKQLSDLDKIIENSKTRNRQVWLKVYDYTEKLLWDDYANILETKNTNQSTSKKKYLLNYVNTTIIFSLQKETIKKKSITTIEDRIDINELKEQNNNAFTQAWKTLNKARQKYSNEMIAIANKMSQAIEKYSTNPINVTENVINDTLRPIERIVNIAYVPLRNVGRLNQLIDNTKNRINNIFDAPEDWLKALNTSKDTIKNLFFPESNNGSDALVEEDIIPDIQNISLNNAAMNVSIATIESALDDNSLNANNLENSVISLFKESDVPYTNVNVLNTEEQYTLFLENVINWNIRDGLLNLCDQIRNLQPIVQDTLQIEKLINILKNGLLNLITSSNIILTNSDNNLNVEVKKVVEETIDYLLNVIKPSLVDFYIQTNKSQTNIFQMMLEENISYTEEELNIIYEDVIKYTQDNQYGIFSVIFNNNHVPIKMPIL
jgi:hypothetical protein